MGSRGKKRRCYSAGVEDRGRGHEPRNAGGLQQLKKVKNRAFLLEPPVSSCETHFKLWACGTVPEYIWVVASHEFGAVCYRSSESTNTRVKTMTLRMLVPASEMRCSAPWVASGQRRSSRRWSLAHEDSTSVHLALPGQARWKVGARADFGCPCRWQPSPWWSQACG